MQCPVCGGEEWRFYWRDRWREYVQCAACMLVFVPPRYYLSAAEEKKRYDLHENSPEDKGYVRFLKKLFDPVVKRLEPGTAGLDFGSGPAPVLAKMFRQAGFPMTLYDVFYAADATALERSYDFITVCETAEHLHHPGRDLTRLYRLLKPGGMLAVMTRPVVPAEEFETWHYRKDETHVCYFAPQTFQWLAEQWGAKLEILPGGVVIFVSEKRKVKSRKSKVESKGKKPVNMSCLLSPDTRHLFSNFRATGRSPLLLPFSTLQLRI